MTPEERAARFMDTLLAQSSRTLSGLQLSIPRVRAAVQGCIADEIRAAIREAVDAETEACATIADEDDEPLDPPNGAAFRIAREIRRRETTTDSVERAGNE